ncbi:hypothetical protein ACGFIP_32220 [Micromonospora zamorensis]|uniref:hypothetical protein n=1 Tax=Micromonospora zamorensis TaxID=709883 RepID=UPI0037103339
MYELLTSLLGVLGLLLVAAGVGLTVAALLAPGPGCLVAGATLIGGAELADWLRERRRAVRE